MAADGLWRRLGRGRRLLFGASVVSLAVPAVAVLMVAELAQGVYVDEKGLLAAMATPPSSTKKRSAVM